MDKERLKEFKQQIDFLDDSADMEDYHRLIDTLKNMYEDGWLKELVSTVEEQSEKINGMAHVIKLKNKEMRELSNFLKKRNIPLKELSPLITAMKFMEEQQKEIEQLHEAFQYFKGAMESETYTDHIKCQDVVCVDDLREGLIAFEALEQSK